MSDRRTTPKQPGKQSAKPRYKPTQTQRDLVSMLAAANEPPAGIAKAVGLKTVAMLRRHFGKELVNGAAEIRAETIQAVVKRAQGGSVYAQRLMLVGLKPAKKAKKPAPNDGPKHERRKTDEELKKVWPFKDGRGRRLNPGIAEDRQRMSPEQLRYAALRHPWGKWRGLIEPDCGRADDWIK